MTGQPEDWVEIGSTIHSEEALAWKDLLISTGIQAKLNPDVDLVDPYPGTTIFGPFRLFVPANIESEARAALEDLRNMPVDYDESE